MNYEDKRRSFAILRRNTFVAVVIVVVVLIKEENEKDDLWAASMSTPHTLRDLCFWKTSILNRAGSQYE